MFENKYLAPKTMAPIAQFPRTGSHLAPRPNPRIATPMLMQIVQVVQCGYSSAYLLGLDDFLNATAFQHFITEVWIFNIFFVAQPHGSFVF